MLTTTEHDGALYLGTLFQEANNVWLFGLIIVIIDFRTELLFLDHSLLLVLTRLAGLLSLLVFEFAVVHDLCDRRLSVRGNLDQVQVCLKSELSCIISADDTYLFASGTDQTYFWYSDALINASFRADCVSPK